MPPKQNVFLEYAKSIGIALVIALMLRQFIFQPFRIPSGSMLETLQIGDHILGHFVDGYRVDGPKAQLLAVGVARPQ